MPKTLPGIGSHQSHKMLNDEWLTPPHILKPLGEFDLDPCAPLVRPWDTARRHYHKQMDGLIQPWTGRVWLNPPYGGATDRWLSRLVQHGNGIALIFARTETRMFFDHVWPRASALLFLQGRLTFHTVDGKPAAHNGGAPSVLIAFGEGNTHTLANSGIPGKFLHLKNNN